MKRTHSNKKFSTFKVPPQKMFSQGKVSQARNTGYFPSTLKSSALLKEPRRRGNSSLDFSRRKAELRRKVLLTNSFILRYFTITRRRLRCSHETVGREKLLLDADGLRREKLPRCDVGLSLSLHLASLNYHHILLRALQRRRLTNGGRSLCHQNQIHAAGF